MSTTVKRIFTFDAFRVDVAERQVLRDGQIIPMTPKIFDILLILLENRGTTVEKNELISRVWPDVFVEEGSLNRNISTLRKVLGDDLNEQKLIKTLPKRGYRFTTRVEEVFEESLPGSSVVVSDNEPEKEAFRVLPNGFRRTSHLRPAVIGLAITGLFAVAAWTVVWSRAERIDSKGLTVFERRQVNEFGSSSREANQAYATGRSLWHRRSAEDLHSSMVSLEQAIQIDPDFALAHSALADAYAFDVFRWKDAERHAKEAMRLNPTLGEPHATIGFIRMFWQWKFDEARDSFRTATALSPEYATAHQWYAISFITGLQGGAALAEMKRAAELDPQSVSINADLCQFYYFLEKHDEAMMQCRKTLELDPNSFNAGELLYEIMTETGQYDEAIDQFFRNDALKSDFALPFAQKEQLKNTYKVGGIRAFWQQFADILTQRKQFYGSAKYFARLGDKEKALNALRLAAEGREFNFVFYQTEPAFRELRSEAAFQGLKKFFEAGLSE